MVEKNTSKKESKPQNYVELPENQIFEKIKKDLSPIQESLSEKKITVDEAKSELKKINEWLQWSKLETKDKKEIWKAFEKLINLEKNIDVTALKDEVNEIVKLLETLTKRDLANLKQWIQQNRQWRNPERPTEVQIWIDESNLALDTTIDDASKDSNPIANRAGKMMKRLNS